MPTTTNYSWTLPTVGGSVNTWGTLLNAILDDIDAKMVSKTATQTLTNKTLTAPVINGFTGDTSAINIGSGQLVKDASGNLGLAVTPSAWSSYWKSLQLGNSIALYGLGSGGNITYLGNNVYINASGLDTYIASDFATTYRQYLGGHAWYTAPSGTAGNAISFTRAMTLDASGNLLVGTTSNAGYGAHIMSSGNANSDVLALTNSNADLPFGLAITYTAAAPNGSGNSFIYCTDTGATRFKVLSNGNAQNVNNSYGAISDIKFKQDITDATPKLAKLLKVRIVNYKFKSDPNGIKQIGVIAQELEEISPGLIEETPDFEEVTLTREVNKTVPVTVKKEVTTERVQLDVVDGVAVQTVMKETATVDEPVVDEYPVFDGDGNPVMEVVTPATDAEIDAEGNEVKAASPAVLRQKIHAVPRMETVLEKEEYTERRPTGTATKSVKYSIFVPMLIKAMQEQQAQIEELKAKVGA